MAPYERSGGARDQRCRVGASSLAFSFWIIHPYWQLGLAA